MKLHTKKELQQRAYCQLHLLFMFKTDKCLRFLIHFFFAFHSLHSNGWRYVICAVYKLNNVKAKWNDILYYLIQDKWNKKKNWIYVKKRVLNRCVHKTNGSNKKFLLSLFDIFANISLIKFSFTLIKSFSFLVHSLSFLCVDQKKFCDKKSTSDQQ